MLVGLRWGHNWVKCWGILEQFQGHLGEADFHAVILGAILRHSWRRLGGAGQLYGQAIFAQLVMEPSLGHLGDILNSWGNFGVLGLLAQLSTFMQFVLEISWGSHLGPMTMGPSWVLGLGAILGLFWGYLEAILGSWGHALFKNM